MTGLLKSLVVKFVKARWGSLLPAVFKSAAEGEFGPQVKAVYWWLSGKKTVTGAVLWGVGAGLEAVCGQDPSLAMVCPWSHYVYYAGMILTGLGLADGGTRAPWPMGADVSAELKR